MGTWLHVYSLKEYWEGHSERMLVEKFSKGNLMASTEVSDNPGMASILKQLGFCRDGKTWKSDIHGKDLSRNVPNEYG
jgi:hypothetical protein